MSELAHKDLSYQIIGAAMEVHSQLKSGFLEAVYQEALSLEFTARDIPFEPLQPLPVLYKGQLLKCKYVADFICFGKIIVEIKALDTLTTKEEAQLLNYLKATGFKLGLLINFGAFHEVQWKRLVN
jgi:GxxExxY protein